MEDTRTIWTQTYITENHKDPHAVYSERTGMSRQEAKVSCYKQLWSTPFLKSVFDSNKT